jgi:Ca2+/Na+ antiporter
MIIGVLFSGSTGFAVGGTIGSSLFITTFVLGLVLLISKVEELQIREDINEKEIASLNDIIERSKELVELAKQK